MKVIFYEGKFLIKNSDRKLTQITMLYISHLSSAFVVKFLGSLIVQKS